MGNKRTACTRMFMIVVLIFGLVSSAHSAQTGGANPQSGGANTQAGARNIAGDAALKDKLRGEVIGNKAFPGEDKEYVIGQGDVLSVTIYGEGNMAATGASASTSGMEMDGMQPTVNREGQNANLAGGVVVRMDGRVSLLHVGDVNVLGMTMSQATEYLKKVYSTVYANPMITVSLMQSNSRRYTVMGEVKTPGVFNFDYPVTIVQAVARSGGFTEWANHDITVVRAGDGVKTPQAKDGKNTVEFSYNDLVKGKQLEKNIYLQAGDIVIVH